MYKVFVVDDEIVVREGVRSNFPWDETEFVLAGEAPDGEIALSMLQDVKPDILITDIRMPFMDGLELCRRVARSMPWIYIVILSGYDDFAYAREAISLGVKEYLLKPVSGQELLAVLERIAERIREDKRQQANLNAYREQVASSSRYLKEKLLTELYGGANGDRILKSARSLQLNLLAKRYLVMLLAPSPEPDSEEAMFAAQSVLERLADGSGGAALVCRGYGGFSFLVMGDSASDLEERAYGLAQAAQYDVERSANVKLLVAIGTDVEALKDIPRSLEDARSIIERMTAGAGGDGQRRIMGWQDIIGDAPISIADMDAAPLAEQLKYATAGDVDRILQNYANGLGWAAAQSVMMANYFFVEMMLAAFRIVSESGGDPHEVIPGAARAQNSMVSVDEVLPLCRDMLQRAITFRDMQGSARYGGVLRKARAFIDEKYCDSNLTLHDVAAHVALSNNHFCTVFSQEMGVTFTEYLTGVRIQHARELLADTAMRTADVAYAVGYNDPHYFSYLFKKNTGLSPRDYRKDEKIGVSSERK